jgi:hypothetical protein
MNIYPKRILVILIMFIIYISLFCCMYSQYLKPIDSLYCALTFTTMTGNQLVDKHKELKTIATIQLFLTYFIFIIFVSSIYHD